MSFVKFIRIAFLYRTPGNILKSQAFYRSLLIRNVHQFIFIFFKQSFLSQVFKVFSLQSIASALCNVLELAEICQNQVHHRKFWVSRISEIHIHFGSNQPLSSLKIKPVAYLIMETWEITPTNLLKENLTYSSIFKAYFKKILASAKASLIFIKNRCKSSRPQMFFKIGVFKKFTIFREKHLCWSVLLIKLQAFWCFPVNIAKFLRIVLL